MKPDRTTLAAYFDGWYADMAQSPAKDEIMRRHLRLPPHLVCTSMVSWEGISELETGLSLGPGKTLLDLACGRGAIGLELAARAGARLVGVDISAEAVRQAREMAKQQERVADFRIGDLTGTDLQTGSVDAVLCMDSIQFAEPPAEAYREIRRVLAPGGRVVLTCWEPTEKDDGRLPARLQDVDLARGLSAAGFDDIRVSDRPDWRDVERGVWEEARSLHPNGNAALQSFHEEGVRSLDTFALLRRVSATALAP